MPHMRQRAGRIGAPRMIQRLRKLLTPDTTRPTDLQIFLEHQQKSESRYHERISELISTLDKIVTAKYDRPIHARVEPNVAQAPLPQHTLSDVLSDDDDESFVTKASEIL